MHGLEAVSEGVTKTKMAECFEDSGVKVAGADWSRPARISEDPRTFRNCRLVRHEPPSTIFFKEATQK